MNSYSLFKYPAQPRSSSLAIIRLARVQFVNRKAPSTKRQENASNGFCPQYAREVWKPNNHRSLWIWRQGDHNRLSWCHIEKLRIENVSRPHQKQAFPNSSELRSVFEAPFSGRISDDGRHYRRGKAAFFNFTCVVPWTGSKGREQEMIMISPPVSIASTVCPGRVYHTKRTGVRGKVWKEQLRGTKILFCAWLSSLRDINSITTHYLIFFQFNTLTGTASSHCGPFEAEYPKRYQNRFVTPPPFP